MLQGVSTERGHRRRQAGEPVPAFVVSIERDTIVFPYVDYESCNGCGRCYISCMDGGHQAINLDPKSGKPKLNGKRCVGCHLCRLVCPKMAIRPVAKYWMPKP